MRATAAGSLAAEYPRRVAVLYRRSRKTSLSSTVPESRNSTRSGNPPPPCSGWCTSKYVLRTAMCVLLTATVRSLPVAARSGTALAGREAKRLTAPAGVTPGQTQLSTGPSGASESSAAGTAPMISSIGPI